MIHFNRQLSAQLDVTSKLKEPKLMEDLQDFNFGTLQDRRDLEPSQQITIETLMLSF